MESLLFYTFAIFAILSALLMITRVNPLMSSLWLVVCLAVSAALFALLAAPFMAVLQVLIYAGAVMVLFIFVIMLIDISKEALKPRIIRFWKLIGAVAVCYLGAMAGLLLWKPPFVTSAFLPESYGSPATLGTLLLTKYAVPFELASLLLLVAMVGAVVMGKRRL